MTQHENPETELRCTENLEYFNEKAERNLIARLKKKLTNSTLSVTIHDWYFKIHDEGYFLLKVGKVTNAPGNCVLVHQLDPASPTITVEGMLVQDLYDTCYTKWTAFLGKKIYADVDMEGVNL
jgi:hypothetical protein